MLKIKNRSGIIFGEELVLRNTIDNREQEIDKLNVIANCAAQNNFIAPRAWPCVRDGIIAMQKIDLIRNVREPYAYFTCKSHHHGREAALYMVLESGRVLALIHSALSNHMKILETDKLSALHGDFGFSNIFLNRESKLVVLDPFPDFYSSFNVWEVGNRSKDLAMFASCLLGRLPVSQLIKLRPEKVHFLLSEFLESYNSTARTAVTLPELLTEARRVASCYFNSSSVGVLKSKLGFAVWLRNYEFLQSKLGGIETN